MFCEYAIQSSRFSCSLLRYTRQTLLFLLPLNRSRLPFCNGLLLYFHGVLLNLKRQRKFCICGLEISVSLDESFIVSPSQGNYKANC